MRLSAAALRLRRRRRPLKPARRSLTPSIFRRHPRRVAGMATARRRVSGRGRSSAGDGVTGLTSQRRGKTLVLPRRRARGPFSERSPDQAPDKVIPALRAGPIMPEAATRPDALCHREEANRNRSGAASGGRVVRFYFPALRASGVRPVARHLAGPPGSSAPVRREDCAAFTRGPGASFFSMRVSSALIAEEFSALPGRSRPLPQACLVQISASGSDKGGVGGDFRRAAVIVNTP
jgi:hypothetical protein